MPLLLKVSYFEGIRIHAGNRAKDTSGCILVGYNTVVGCLTESQDTFVELFDRLLKAREKIEIEIFDFPHSYKGIQATLLNRINFSIS